MKIFDLSKIIALALLLALSSPLSYAQIGMRELGDSLMAYTGFSRLWSPSVRVKQLRVSGDNVSVRTNQTLHDFRWTDQNLDSLCRKVSLWTLGHENGKVTIYAGSTEKRRTSPSVTSSSTPATVFISTATGRSGYGNAQRSGQP